MKKAFCKNDNCTAATTGHCFNNKGSMAECENWVPSGQVTATMPSATGVPVSGQPKQTRSDASKKQGVEWSGFPLRLAEIELISRRSNPLIIAAVGEVAAGKSSFLGMLHTLLLRGHTLQHYTFAGSLTLLGWEALAVALRFHKGQATDQSPTPSDPSYYSLQHWALRRADGRLLDILFPDASGEVFSQWAINQDDSNAANVRWIHRHADAFVFFVNCKALVEQRGEAVTNLLDLASRLAEGLANRPVVVAWSKADFLTQVRPTVKQRLEEGLQQVFGDVPRVEISKELQEQPDPRQLNNLHILDMTLQQLVAFRPASPELLVPVAAQDHFYQYRGR
jgi:Double-GTPase 2